jgi:hypothetical protein
MSDHVVDLTHILHISSQELLNDTFPSSHTPVTVTSYGVPGMNQLFYTTSYLSHSFQDVNAQVVMNLYFHNINISLDASP